MQSEKAIVARICHDLITPFNAINLGLEAFEMSRDESLLSSIRESVDKANCIMRFMRELFSDKSQMFCYSDTSLKQMIAEFLKFYNITFDLKSDMENVAYIAGKIIMYMAIVTKEIMPYGGMVTTTINDEDSEISTKCCGRNIVVPQMKIENEENINQKNIIKQHLMLLLNESGFELTVISEGQDVIFIKKIK
ncbi:MAG: hypothetical protein IJ730_05560 [Alphaproteobacteria bacterium]|nr:hypothetical protein [Alphaproteobacteria bacterium]